MLLAMHKLGPAEAEAPIEGAEEKEGEEEMEEGQSGTMEVRRESMAIEAEAVGRKEDWGKRSTISPGPGSTSEQVRSG